MLDSSAVLAWLQQEPGGDTVGQMLDGGVITAANWSEVLQKTHQHGGDLHEVGLLLRSLGVDISDVTGADGEQAAKLWERENPLSLGDRICLSVAHRLGLPAVTAESRWMRWHPQIDVQLIR